MGRICRFRCFLIVKKGMCFESRCEIGKEGMLMRRDRLSYNITGAADATFNQFVALPEYFEIVPGDPLTV